MTLPISMDITRKVSVFSGVVANLTCYSLTHALIDATCAAVVLGIANMHSIGIEEIFFYIILYNTLAFGTQAFFGIIVDKWQIPRLTAIVGSLLVASSAVVVWVQPLLAVLLAGVGNALFHIGGGAISLNLKPGTASFPGIFVAPGAFGLIIGGLIGKAGLFTSWPFVVLLLISCVFMLLITEPDINYERKPIKAKEGFIEIIVLLLLFSISIRSVIGLSLVLPWKANLFLLFTFAVALVAGKSIGGILADRFGWIKVAMAALLISAPMLAFGAKVPYIAIPGAFIFQMTMPITLVAIASVFPGRPAFGFGLPCLALLFGALIAFTELKLLFNISVIVLITILISMACVFVGLKMFFRIKSC